jgi:hypothetical protein
MRKKGGREVDKCQIKREKDIYHHDSKPISIICHLPDPTCFHRSLPLTLFKKGPLSSVKFDDVEKLKYFLLSKIKKNIYLYHIYQPPVLSCVQREGSAV